MKIPKSILLLSAIFLVACLLAACKGKGPNQSDRPRRAAPPITLTIIHDSAVQSFMKLMKDRFEQYKPSLANGSLIKIGLTSRLGIDAARELASGKLKVDGWLSPSPTLTNYTNHNLRNLGAKQDDCRQLFGTPVVIAVRESLLKKLRLSSRQPSLDELINNESVELEAGISSSGSISLSHAQPSKSHTGLASLIQLAYIANSQNDKLLDLAALNNEQSLANLRKYEGLVSNYGFYEQSLLRRTAARSAKLHRLNITTEQQMVSFNSTGVGEEKLIALYPREGSYWQNYYFCRSQADWVSPAKKAAFKMFSEFLSSDKVQTEIREMGFRPARLAAMEPAPPLTEEFGMTPSLPSKLLIPVKGETVTHLLKIWPELQRPAATILIMDSSGSMQGEASRIAKQQLRMFVENMNEKDLTALVSFSSTADLKSDFSPNKSQLLNAINKLHPAGGSVLYDALTLALRTLTQDQVQGFRKTIVLLTDGQSKDSTMSLSLLLATLKNAVAHNDINLILIGITGGDLDSENLRQITLASDGVYKETSIQDLYETFQEILKILA